MDEMLWQNLVYHGIIQITSMSQVNIPLPVGFAVTWHLNGGGGHAQFAFESREMGMSIDKNSLFMEFLTKIVTQGHYTGGQKFPFQWCPYLVGNVAKSVFF